MRMFNEKEFEELPPFGEEIPDFIDSAIRKAVRESLGRLRVLPLQGESGNDPKWGVGFNACARNVNSNITTELKKLE